MGVLSGPGHCETSSPPSPSVLNTHKSPKIIDVSTEIFHQKHSVTITINSGRTMDHYFKRASLQLYN